jgi:hypothetical protein
MDVKSETANYFRRGHCKKVDDERLKAMKLRAVKADAQKVAWNAAWPVECKMLL